MKKSAVMNLGVTVVAFLAPLLLSVSLAHADATLTITPTDGDADPTAIPISNPSKKYKTTATFSVSLSVPNASAEDPKKKVKSQDYTLTSTDGIMESVTVSDPAFTATIGSGGRSATINKSATPDAEGNVDWDANGDVNFTVSVKVYCDNASAVKKDKLIVMSGSATYAAPNGDQTVTASPSGKNKFSAFTANAQLSGSWSPENSFPGNNGVWNTTPALTYGVQQVYTYQTGGESWGTPVEIKITITPSGLNIVNLADWNIRQLRSERVLVYGPNDTFIANVTRQTASGSETNPELGGDSQNGPYLLRAGVDAYYFNDIPGPGAPPTEMAGLASYLQAYDNQGATKITLDQAFDTAPTYKGDRLGGSAAWYVTTTLTVQRNPNNTLPINGNGELDPTKITQSGFLR
jgi:hypothetical protein